MSPAIHNAGFEALGIDAHYELLATPAAELQETVHSLRRGALAGANVTIPHKRDVLAHTDERTAEVAVVRSANTLLCEDGAIVAHNTDIVGFESALGQLLPDRMEVGQAVILGAGGAARAIAHSLLLRGWSVTIMARRSIDATMAAEWLSTAHDAEQVDVGLLSDNQLVPISSEADLLVNATPVGAAPGNDRCLWPEDVPIPHHLAVMDIVAWPIESLLVERARRDGAAAIGGLPMLLGQAAEAFRLFTGSEAPIEEMRRAALRAARDRVGEKGYGRATSKRKAGSSGTRSTQSHTERDR